MRASTLFGLTIAILIGMAVVFGMKSAGLFNQRAEAKVAKQYPRILVARQNLFDGVTTTASDVVVRAVEESEMGQYEANKHRYMQPYPEAAHLRTLVRNVGANEPLLKEHFQDLALPDSFNKLLRPGMRAVNLQMPKDRAAGGVIRKDDLVDVYLTTTLCGDPGCTKPETLTAPIAQGLRVVMKRDSIWTVMQANDESKPIGFTLEANPYRAALIEFAKGRGYLTLFPNGGEQSGAKASSGSYGDQKDEDRRVLQTLGGQPIGDIDLEEIFRVRPILPPPPAVPPIRTEHWTNVRPSGMQTWPGDTSQLPNGAAAQPGSDGRVRQGYNFQSPSIPTSGPVTVPCPTCPGGKRTISQ